MAAFLDVAVSCFLERLIIIAEKEVKMMLGVHAEIRALRERLSSLQAHLVQAERRQLHGELISIWLKDLREVVYEVDDILDEYIIKTERLQRVLPRPSNLLARLFLPFHSCVAPCSLGDLANRMKQLNGKLADIDRRKSDPGLHATGGASDNCSRNGSQLMTVREVRDYYIFFYIK